MIELHIPCKVLEWLYTRQIRGEIMSIYFTKQKVELSNWDFSIDPNNPIDCESCQDPQNFMCEWCMEVEWEDRLYTLELIAADLQELGWTKMYIPAWLGGWNNDVRGLKDPLLEVTGENLKKIVFPYDTDITSTVDLSTLPISFSVKVSHHDRPMGEVITIKKGNDMKEM